MRVNKNSRWCPGQYTRILDLDFPGTFSSFFTFPEYEKVGVGDAFTCVLK
jgi:hypothetical protein